jgi:hypothetical protein
MSNVIKAVLGALAVCAFAGAFAQPGYQQTVPHLIYSTPPDGYGTVIGDGSVLYRPEVINLDGLTIRAVLTYCVTIDENTIVQAIRLEKDTPWWKCTGFVDGPGSGLNTNFTTGWRKATNDDLDKDVVNLALGIPQGHVGLGNRALLFSPPNTKYTIKVEYVLRDPGTGRIGVPQVCVYYIQVKVPTVADIRAAIDYFSTVAAGATQKPKISHRVVKELNDALDNTDPLTALLAFEEVVAERSIDFAAMLSAPNGDVRFLHGYMIDDSEEPIGCLLVEMANAALWF